MALNYYTNSRRFMIAIVDYKNDNARIIVERRAIFKSSSIVSAEFMSIQSARDYVAAVSPNKLYSLVKQLGVMQSEEHKRYNTRHYERRPRVNAVEWPKNSILSCLRH